MQYVTTYLNMILISLSVYGCALDTRGIAQRNLSIALKSDGVIDRDAMDSYMAGDYGSARDKWTAISRNISNRRLQNETSFYVDMQYFELARAYSNIAWSSLVDGDITSAREYYDNAFNTLYDGESGHARTLSSSKQTEISNTVALNTLATIQGTISNNKFNTYMSNYIKHETARTMSDPAFYLPRKPPTIVQNLSDRTSDGIRVNVLPSLPPLTNIGKLVGPDHFCTASLIAHKIALTNAHCVHRGKDGHGQLWQQQPAANLNLIFEGAEVTDVVNIVDIVVSKKNQSQNGWLHGDWKEDWALLVLDRHPARRGYLGMTSDISELSAGYYVFVAGYSGDQSDGRILSLHWGCHVSSLADDLYHGNCRTFKGSSGAPLLLTDGKTKHVYVVGLNAFSRAIGDSGGLTAKRFENEFQSLIKRIKSRQQ